MIITLTTDFGLEDPFVGIMKGVILGIAPGAQVIDITHGIRSYNILQAAFLIDNAYSYFPAGTVHVIVVDPGVGSARRPIATVAKEHLFVAPDNGVLSCIFNNDSAAADSSVYWIQNRNLFLNSISQTFHGRDIFAPVAAHLARGARIESVGPRIDDFVKKELPKPQPRDGKVVGTVLHVDSFGNVITNLKQGDLAEDFAISVSGSSITRLCASFSDGAPGELFAIVGSAGYIELALNQGSAADRLNVGSGAEIELETHSLNQ
jgi:S-adenosylmethionine hydrolase